MVHPVHQPQFRSNLGSVSTIAFLVSISSLSILLAADSSHPQLHQLLKPLPESLTSFGAMTQDGYLYVFSGHNGEMHSFSRDSLNPKFRRVQFDNPDAQWEELSMDAPAQSVSLVSDGRVIYRIAGLSFNNSASEPQSFHSTNNFASYDPGTDQWTQLAPLPEGRSSLDAAILGRSIYVVGGWNLQGESSGDAQWHESMLRFDLDDPQAGWQTLPGPGYKVRALTVAAHGDRIVALGGMTPRGFTRKVAIYDTISKIWSEGPELLADHAAAGFASSAFSLAGNLYNAGASGILYRLSPDASAWQVADHLMFPRNFLRLLPAGQDRLLAIGGTGAVGRTAAVESLTVGPERSAFAKWLSWTVDGLPARSGQAVCIHQGKLYSFGGTTAEESTSTSDSQPLSDACEIDLSLQTVRKLPPIPKPLKNAVAISHASTSAHGSIFVLGGVVDEASSGNPSTVWQFDPSSDQWTEHQVAIPINLTGFAALRYDDAFWILGGSRNKQFNESIFHWWGDESVLAPLPKVQLPTNRRDFGCGVIEQEFYLIGGVDQQGQPVSQVDVFDAKRRTWRVAASPSTTRLFPQVASNDKSLFIFGDYTSDQGQLQSALTLEAYDKSKDQWTTLSDSLPQLSADTRLLSLQGRLLFFGVAPSNPAQSQLVIYYPNLVGQTPTVSPMSFAGFTSRGAETPEQTAKNLMRKDADKDGLLSKAEIGQRMTAFFDSADKDQDGLLSHDDVLLAVRNKELEDQDDKDSQ